ncbi:MAG: 50S ribosome-binding GTPase [Firmicutes bacterium]|nr:50S ribosome-binding GTPase [Bacillota bacterium]MCL5038904.1 50S ribosome-binding GTPase [Bacillota bacterium]
MNDCLMVGKPNVGKTLFLLNFAEFLGVKIGEITKENPDGSLESKIYRLEQAKATLVGSEPHTTRGLLSLTVGLPMGKGKTRLTLVDSTGLTDSIHTVAEVRRAMVQTLRRLRKADLILHLLDAAEIGESPAALAEIDRQIARYASSRCPYAILPNKMDLPAAMAGLRSIKEAFPNQNILPVSALQRTGFREVKAFVSKNL